MLTPNSSAIFLQMIPEALRSRILMIAGVVSLARELRSPRALLPCMTVSSEFSFTVSHLRFSNLSS